MSKVFIAIDGDDVGNRLEYFMLMNRLDELSAFSASFHRGFSWLSERLEDAFQALIVFAGGDNLLATMVATDDLVERIEVLRDQFVNLTGQSLSVGIGDSARQAYVALKLAKASGKNRICVYEEDDNG